MATTPADRPGRLSNSAAPHSHSLSLKPVLSAQLNLAEAIEGNTRGMIPPQIEELVKSMREKIRDFEIPILLYVNSEDVREAKIAASDGRPYPYRILVFSPRIILASSNQD